MAEAKHDIILFNRISNDDRLALNTLFSNYYKKLCTFASTYLHNEEEAEEIVADVFYHLWKNRHSLQIEKNVKSYLYVAVKHAALAALKKRRPEFDDMEEVMLLTNLPDTASSENGLDYLELQQYVERAIDRLPMRCRQIFIMNRFDGLRYKEIGEILDISEKTVENQIVKALSIIRASLHKYQAIS